MLNKNVTFAIKIEDMAFYQLRYQQKLNSNVDEIWDFISSPKNLKTITPDSMGFDITSDNYGEKIYPGMIICYKVKPLLGINMRWVTEITQVDEKKMFIDEQRVGPYNIWHHEHKIEAFNQGTLMTDLISYQPPLGILGAIANTLIIKRQLQSIFDYRNKVLKQLFEGI